LQSVVYNNCYNISFWGLENLHPFDSKKFQHVLALLEESGVLRRRQLVTAREASHGVLRGVHGEAYLRKLDTSSVAVAQVSA
jgi:histone deacetylase 11